jgi:hypothetical protein
MDAAKVIIAYHVRNGARNAIPITVATKSATQGVWNLLCIWEKNLGM